MVDGRERGVEVVRQGGIDLLALYLGTRQVLSAHPPSKVGLLPDLFDVEETARHSSPVSRLGLSPSPSP